MEKNSYLKALEQETAHRKRWLDKPVRTKRYIRGMINNYIKEKLRSRREGQQTTDPYIRARVLAKTGDKCYICLRQYTTNTDLAQRLPKLYFTRLQIDHIVPFSKWGPNRISNYMPICSQCNNKKSDLSLAEYRGGMKRPRWRRK